MGKVESSMEIYLQFGGKRLQLPVNPDEIEIKYPSNNKDYDVLGIGQVVVQRKPALKEVSWECFFPARRTEPYVNAGARQPEIYVSCLEKAMEDQQPGRLIITRSGLYDTNMRCIVDDFKTIDKGGEPEDIYYEITLREYRSYAPQTVQIITSPEQGMGQADASAETDRPVETPVLRVGASVIANGKYWYDSYGAKPFGTANNLQTTVTRIVDGNPYPVHIGSYGWLSASQLQIVG